MNTAADFSAALFFVLGLVFFKKNKRPKRLNLYNYSAALKLYIGFIRQIISAVGSIFSIISSMLL